MNNFKLGDVIGKARRAKGMSLRELSRKTDISHPYLSQLETGKNDSPSKEFLLKLADVLQLPFAFLISISSTDMGIAKDIPKDIIDKYRYYIPGYIDNIDFDSFIKLVLSTDINNRPGYYTDEKIEEIKSFFNEVKALEELTRGRSNAKSIEVLNLILKNQKSISGVPKLINDKPSISLKEILLSDIEVMINDKPLSEEDKLKLLEIANTIFK